MNGRSLSPAAQVARGVEAVVQQVWVAGGEGGGANDNHANPKRAEDEAEENIGAPAALLEL